MEVTHPADRQLPGEAGPAAFRLPCHGNAIAIGADGLPSPRRKSVQRCHYGRRIDADTATALRKRWCGSVMCPPGAP